jgi:hypothetical protein
MTPSLFSQWIAATPLVLVGIMVLAAMALVAGAGYRLRQHKRGGDEARGAHSDSQENYLGSAVFGLLALLLGFTYSLAIHRYEMRRELVLAEANAIGTTYLRAQMLGEPHRTRLSGLLVAYIDNRIALGEAGRGATAPLLAVNDRIIADLWAAQVAAFDSIRTLPFSAASAETMNNLIDLDMARKSARNVRLPDEVFAILLIYMVVTAGVLGYALSDRRGRLAAGFLMGLFTLALVMVIDVDRPTSGAIRESQLPMELTRAALKAQPPASFDRYRAAN